MDSNTLRLTGQTTSRTRGQQLKALLVFTCIALLATAARAATISTTYGDLILGFQVEGTGGNPGFTSNLEIDLGPVTQLYAGSNITFSALAVQDLVDTYGAGWASRSDLQWGVVATANGTSGSLGFPANTLWATAPSGNVFVPGSDAAQGLGRVAIAAMIAGSAPGRLNGATSTSNSVYAAVLNNTVAGSWTVQDLKTIGTSFNYFVPSVDSLANPGAGQVTMDVYELQPNTAGLKLGTFILTSTSITFQPAGGTPTRIVGVSGNLAFGNVITGTTAMATMTITNTGNADLTVSSITYPSGFTGAYSGVIAAGAAHDVMVTFAPLAITSYGGTVTVNSDATSGTSTIAASGTGTAVPAPSIGVSGNLAFGNVVTGTTAMATLTITNTGSATLNVSSISYPSGFSGTYSGAIPAGGSHGVMVTFAPVAITSYSGTVTVNSDASSGTSTIAASGTGTAVPTPIIGVSGNLAFGNVTTGTTAMATLTITNAGNGTLTVSSITYPGGFTGTYSGAIPAGGSHDVTVTFAPLALTSYGGTVTVNSDASSGTSTIAASGTGSAVATRIIGLSGDLAFGSINTGTTATATLTITNAGNATLTVSSITYPSGFSGAYSGAIPAGGTHDVTVTFAPTSVTSYGGTVTVNSDKTSGANTIAASGTGTAIPSRIIGLSGTLAFGSVTTGTTATATLTITNAGNTTLTVSSITYPSGFSGDYSGAIPAGGSHDVTVTFAPIALTGYSGTVTVNSDKTSGTSTIAASGTGTSIPNRAPEFVLGPLVNNAVLSNGTLFVVLADTPAVMITAAVDPDSDPVSYLWDFGDGTSTNGDLVSHTYTNCGAFNASVVATDGSLSNTAPLTVSVPCEFDTNATTKLQLKLNFAKPNGDSAKFQSAVALDPAFDPSGQTVLLSIGGALQQFVLDSKGKGVNDQGMCQLKFSSKTGMWTVKASFKKGTWQSEWANVGLDNADNPKPGVVVTIPVILVVGSESFMLDQDLTYTSTKDKSGNAK